MDVYVLDPSTGEMDDRHKAIVSKWRVPSPRMTAEGPLRFSVGYYRGRHRVTCAWFLDYDTAQKFADGWRAVKPWLVIDVLESFF